MRKFLIGLLLLAAIFGGALAVLRGPMEQTRTAALKAFPIYSFVRLRDMTLMRASHAGTHASNRLEHRRDLATPRDRSVTTPNNDTLYSSAFLDLAAGPVQLTMPKPAGRYLSVAVMDARTDHAFVIGTRVAPGGETISIEYDAGKTGAGKTGADKTEGAAFPRHVVRTPQAWLLIRTLVDGPQDLDAARAVQQGFVLRVPEGSRRPDHVPQVRPVLPGPAELLEAVNPVIAESPSLRDPALAATGYGGGADAFAQLPAWRQWLWRLLLPRIFQRMSEAIAEGSVVSADGWSITPPGIGTAAASNAVRAGVALAGLGALPAEEAVYWSATQDSARAPLDGAGRYRLTIPADVPAGAFWSLSLYERLPDGRLFYIENPMDRFAIGNRTPGLMRNRDGSLTILLSSAPPQQAANWLPAPRAGPFTLIFRAYLPAPEMRNGTWRLPAVERVSQ